MDGGGLTSMIVAHGLPASWQIKTPEIPSEYTGWKIDSIKRGPQASEKQKSDSDSESKDFVKKEVQNQASLSDSTVESVANSTVASDTVSKSSSTINTNSQCFKSTVDIPGCYATTDIEKGKVIRKVSQNFNMICLSLGSSSEEIPPFTKPTIFALRNYAIDVEGQVVLMLPPSGIRRWSESELESESDTVGPSPNLPNLSLKVSRDEENELVIELVTTKLIKKDEELICDVEKDELPNWLIDQMQGEEVEEEENAEEIEAGFI